MGLQACHTNHRQVNLRNHTRAKALRNLVAIQGRSSPVTDLSTSDLETLRRDGEFVLYRGRIERDESRFLLLEPTSDPPTLRSLGCLEHEYALRGELDAS